MTGKLKRQATILIAMWLGGASAASARFLQTDPIGYKDQVNLYAYVNNDPIDNRDPTGTYICEGSAANCSAFAGSLQRGRDALAGKDLSKADRAAISGVLKTYGKEGVRNGVGVTFRSQEQIRAVTSGAAYTQYFPKNGASVVVLPNTYSTLYNNFAKQEQMLGATAAQVSRFSSADERSNIAFHEGRHAQDQQAGRPVTEPPAYRTGEAINRAYGSQSVRQISNEITGENEHDN